MENFNGNPTGFLDAIKQGAIKLGTGLGNLIFGNPLDEDGNVKPLNPGYQGPGFQGLPDHQKEKEYQLLREQGPQASAIPFLNDFMVSGFQSPPAYIKESMDRQRTGGSNYSIEDKKNIIDWTMKTRA